MNIDIEQVNTVLGKAVGHFQQQENEMLTRDLDDDTDVGDDGDNDDSLDEV